MKNILENAKKLLLSRTPESQHGNVCAHWSNVEWFPSKTESNDYVEFIPGSSLVYIYNSCKRLSDAGRYYFIIRAFGNYVYSLLDEKSKNIWIKKLCIPSGVSINKVRIKIENSPTDSSFYNIVVGLKTPMERLVALNIVNAFIASKITLPKIKGIDIVEHPLTSDYCNFKVYHSALPAITPYLPFSVVSDFGTALAEIVSNDVGVASHTDAKYVIKEIVSKIISRI